MKKLLALFITAAFCSVFAVPSWSVLSQGQQLPNVPVQSANVGRIVNSYRKQQPGARPAWVNDALDRSIAHLKQNGAALGLANAETELTLLGADQDDLGMTHVRLDQMWNGVTVFGGQIVTHLDATDKSSINRQKFDFTTGRIFPDARSVNTIPTLPAASAIAQAITALGYKDAFARTPEAELVILAETAKRDRDVPGAALTWKVELLILDGTEATASHLYFVNAHNGAIEWH